MRPYLSVLTGLLAALAPAYAQEKPAQHARVELISQQSSIAAGSNAQLGVHFILDPGWHIYWVNPGDSGQPPSFKWNLPAGFSADQVQWPPPERMQAIKELADFGYHNDVLLPLTLHVPASAKSFAEVAADAKWLVCREVCIPEHTQLLLTLPVAAKAQLNPSTAGLFANTKKLLPKPLPHGWKTKVISEKDDFILSVTAGTRIAKAEFFPLDPGQIDNPSPQKAQPSGTGITVTLKKSDLLVKPINVLRGVLVIPGNPPYQIEAPVHQPLQ
jgi:DsbC/DsbD-like thiol-disulfide interchange protein